MTSSLLIDEPDFALGVRAVSPSTGELRRGARTERLEPRVMQVLLILVQAQGRTVSRDRLMDEAWGRLVTEDAISRCILRLRSAFADDPAVSILTVPKIGYRLTVTDAPAVSADALATPTRRWKWPAAGLAFILGGATVFALGAYVAPGVTAAPLTRCQSRGPDASPILSGMKWRGALGH